MALAVGRSLASQQAHMLRCICLYVGWVNLLLGALIPAPYMPEVGVLLQVIPFLQVSHRHCVTGVTAKRLAVGVVRRA